MSSLQAQAGNAQTRTDAERKTAVVLLNAIAAAVAEIKEENAGVDYEIPRLKQLAEAYALVAHGKG